MMNNKQFFSQMLITKLIKRETNNSAKLKITCSFKTIGMSILSPNIKFFKFQKINFSGAKIGDDGLVLLLDSINSSENKNFLKILNLSNNRLTAQGLKYFKENMKTCINMEVLNISYNQLDSNGVAHLREYLKENSYLKQLHLSHTKLNCQLISELWNNFDGGEELNFLNFIDLSCNELSDKGVEVVSKLLKNTSSIKKIDLSSNKINPEGFLKFFENLNFNKTLNVLLIGFNKMNTETLSLLAEYLLDNKTLNVLSINDCQINEGGCLSFAICLRYNNTIKVLNLSGNNLGYLGIKFLSNELCHNSCLEVIELNSTSIYDEGCAFLCNVLCQNNTIKHLSLESNSITIAGVKLLYKGLTLNSSLEKLNFSDNLLSDEGVETLLDSFFESKFLLKELYLSMTDCGKDISMVNKLGKFLIEKPLQILCLKNNNFDLTTGGILAKAVKSNQSLVKLDLSYNCLGQDGVKNLILSLEKNNKLEYVNLSHNKVKKSESILFSKIPNTCKNLLF